MLTIFNIDFNLENLLNFMYYNYLPIDYFGFANRYLHCDIYLVRSTSNDNVL